MATRLPGREEEKGSGSRVFRDLVSIIIIFLLSITDLILLHKIEICRIELGPACVIARGILISHVKLLSAAALFLSKEI